MFSVTIEQEVANRDLQKRYDLISYNQELQEAGMVEIYV